MKLTKHSLITALALGSLVAFSPLLRGQENQENDRPRRERPANGDRERRPGGRGGNQLEMIVQRLKLSDEQKSKLQPILQEEMTKLRELRQDTALTPEKRREKVREIREQNLAKVKPILTTEQFEQFKKLREQGPGRGQRGPGQGRGPRENRPEAPKE